jgi:hypothetical protein
MDDDEIRRRIRDKMASGDLPRQHSVRTWAGFGTGKTCGACDDAIQTDTVELEAEGVDRKFRFYHSRCYMLLAQERNREGPASEPRCDDEG